MGTDPYEAQVFLTRISFALGLYVLVLSTVFLTVRDVQQWASALTRRARRAPVPGGGAASGERLVAVYNPAASGPGAIELAAARGLVIGGDPTCDVVIRGDGVPPALARLGRDLNGHWLVEAVDGTSGTLCNGQPVIQPQRLQPDDRVTFGPVDYRYELL